MKLLVLHEAGLMRNGVEITTVRELKFIEISDELIKKCHEELDKILGEEKDDFKKN
jgi:hypothetical protein